MEWTDADVRTWKRTDRGGVVYVVVPGTSGWVSSGKRRKTAAVEWALHQASGGFAADVTLGEYARDFFIPGLCPRVKLIEQSGGKNVRKSWYNMRQVHEAYILPAWGKTMLAAIQARAFFDWLTGPLLTVAKFEGKRRPISASQRNRIHSAMNHIFAQARFDGILDRNPLDAVPRIKDERPPRGVLTDEEFRKVFPEDLAELDHVWGSRRWAVYFMVLADTGMRPGEALALHWTDWHPVPRAFIVSKGVDDLGRIGPLKTARKGVDRRVGLVGVRTAALLEGLRDGDTGLIFPGKRSDSRTGGTMRTMVARDHFLKSLERAGVDRAQPGAKTLPLSTYSLRHAANTGFRTDFGDEAARLLMGHTTEQMTENYDHAGDAELVARALKAVGRG